MIETERAGTTPPASAVVAPPEPRNGVLRALPREEYARLLPHLEPCEVAAREVLADAERPLAHVCFPETAILSVLRRLRDGTLIEAYAVGRDGAAGIADLLVDRASSAGVVVVNVPGACRRVPLHVLRVLLPELPALQAMIPRLLVALLDEVQQAVACSGLHSVEQRCAGWLVRAHDRVSGEAFALTHEVLARTCAAPA